MNPDDFEKRLQRLPLREIPPEWREKILQGAETPRHSSSVIRHSFLSTINSKLSTVLWPHPKAWAGLAALWLVIAAADFASSDSPTQIAQKPAQPSAETLVLVQQQQRLLAELIGPALPKDADRPKHNAAQPRSERRMETRYA
jgi:hypothetical protein